MSTVEERLRRLEDVEEIRRLDAVYCRLIDDGDWPALVALFTEDGVFDGLSRVAGRSHLLAFFSGLADGGLTAYWHHVSNLEVEVAGDAATVRSLLWQPCVVDGVPHVAAGRYRDELVRTGEGWRYRVKQVRFSYWAPLTVGWDQHRFSLEAARAAAVPRGVHP
ncbi:MAG TPA: nuclear transport factor 2 family protein [Geodermatophilus sp.]|nr:nuclear transport factor 2 family protein [Geodermatophilus sp.]